MKVLFALICDQVVLVADLVTAKVASGVYRMRVNGVTEVVGS